MFYFAKDNAMLAIVVKPNGIIYEMRLNEPLHRSAGTIVKGGIEVVKPQRLSDPYCFICNEEFFFKDFSVNPIASYLYGTDLHGNPICGNIVIMKFGYRNGELDVVGLSAEEARDIERDLELIRSWFSLEVQHG